MNQEEKKALYEAIMSDIASVVLEHIEKIFPDDETVDGREELYENVDSVTEKKNEQYVQKLCNQYKLEYYEGDSVCAEKNKLNILQKVHEIVGQRMPVGKIRWVGGKDNCYHFCFFSNQSKRL